MAAMIRFTLIVFLQTKAYTFFSQCKFTGFEMLHVGLKPDKYIRIVS